MFPTSAARYSIDLPNSLPLAKIHTTPCSTSSFLKLKAGPVPVYNLSKMNFPKARIQSFFSSLTSSAVCSLPRVFSPTEACIQLSPPQSLFSWSSWPNRWTGVPTVPRKPPAETSNSECKLSCHCASPWGEHSSDGRDGREPCMRSLPCPHCIITDTPKLLAGYWLESNRVWRRA